MTSAFEDSEPEQLELFRDYRREELRHLIELLKDPTVMAPLNRLEAYHDKLNRAKAKLRANPKRSSFSSPDDADGNDDRSGDRHPPAA